MRCSHLSLLVVSFALPSLADAQEPPPPPPPAETGSPPAEGATDVAPPPPPSYPQQQPAPAAPQYPQTPPGYQAPPAAQPYQAPPEPREPASGVRTHDGFYLRMGLGLGGGGVTTESEGVDGTYSGGGWLLDLLLGGTVGNMVTIGGGLMTMELSDPRVEVNVPGAGAGAFQADGALGIVTLGPFVDVFFGPHSGGHVGALVGVGAIGLEDEAGDSSSGFGLSVFGGYDFWISDQWALGIDARYLRVTGERSFPTLGLNTDEVSNSFGLMFSALYH